MIKKLMGLFGKKRDGGFFVPPSNPASFGLRKPSPVGIPPVIPPPTDSRIVGVYFSPKGGCADAIVKAINGAKRSIEGQVFVFSSLPIAQALIDAKDRGVEVVILADGTASRDETSVIPKLHQEGVPIFLDKMHAIANSKVLIIDDRIVVTGSMNWSSAGEFHNVENLIVIEDEAVARAYKFEWSLHRNHSKPLEPPDDLMPAPGDEALDRHHYLG